MKFIFLFYVLYVRSTNKIVDFKSVSEKAMILKKSISGKRPVISKYFNLQTPWCAQNMSFLNRKMNGKEVLQTQESKSNL
jgi:hypothetical protein